MRKNNYRIARIPKGEDNPCKECDVFLNNGICTGNCRLIRQWRWIEGQGYKGYIYKSKKK